MPQPYNYLNSELITNFIKRALEEDIGPGDFSSEAAIKKAALGQAELLVKDTGILAGMEVAKEIFAILDNELDVDIYKQDGEHVIPGDIILKVSGSARSILSGERLVLNFLQRMSGIASKTKKLALAIDGTGASLLDTRKTTPNFRLFEKWAVKIGGGKNHRFALFDMIMLKDNHNDYAGGIIKSVASTKKFLTEKSLDLKIEVEARSLDEVSQALLADGVDIILLDNMSTRDLRKSVELIDNRCLTEASGGIDIENIRDVAETGVNFISVGALTHSYKSLDMSLKARLSK